MLSVCIPVYRYDVRPLVAELLRQAVVLEETVEILVYDDASPDDGDWGREGLRQTSGIHYVELGQNLGRAAIRNKLAGEASQPYLVMMDADGAPNQAFLRCWIDEIKDVQHLTVKKNPQFVCVGGRYYQPEGPPDSSRSLHWWYGVKRESFSVNKRTNHSWMAFHSNNFLVSRSVMLEHPFPETHAGYGHEDTLWGQQFIDTEILIFHLHNPVIHLGLETNAVFLKKQKQAITNLRLLKNSHPHLRTRLIDLADRFPFLPQITSLIPEPWLVNYLTGRERPLLYALDLLKLRWWHKG